MRHHANSLALLSLAAMLATACGADDDASIDPEPASSTGTEDPSETSDTPQDSSSSGDPEGDSSGGGIDLDALYACEDPDLVEVRPLSGPGFDPAQGLLDPVQETYVAFTTQILVEPDQQDHFLEVNAQVVEQLEAAEGLVAYTLALEPNCGFGRTLGVWRSEGDMYKFVGSGAHAQAIAQANDIAITGKTISWTVDASEVPMSWEVARAQLASVEPLIQ